MNALEGKVPANVKIYHYGVPGRKRYDLTNPVILNRPVLSLDPFAMAQARIQQPASIYDKQRREVFPAIRRLGRYVIYQGANDWPKLSYLDGNRLSMMVPMEVAPVSLKEALDFVRRNHRHCAATTTRSAGRTRIPARGVLRRSSCLMTSSSPTPAGRRRNRTATARIREARASRATPRRPELPRPHLRLRCSPARPCRHPRKCPRTSRGMRASAGDRTPSSRAEELETTMTTGVKERT